MTHACTHSLGALALCRHAGMHSHVQFVWGLDVGLGVCVGVAGHEAGAVVDLILVWACGS